MKVVVFTGYNQRAIIAFLRTLEKNKLDYSIIASGNDDAILHTQYGRRDVYIRKNKELVLEEIVAFINVISDGEDKLFIAPSTEFLNRFLLKNRDVFEAMGCVIPLCNNKLYETISDKHAFATLCDECNIAIPMTYTEIEKYKGPIIAKPKKYEGSDGKIYSPIFLSTKNDYEVFVKEHCIADFDFQEFLSGGESIYLLYYITREGEVYKYSQQNIAQQTNGKSMLAAIGTEHYQEETLVTPYTELFLNNGFRGLVMVEIRRYNNRDYMIEANPRFWGPSQLFCDAGCNFFEVLLWDYGLIKDKPFFEYKDDCFYYWKEGFNKEGNECVWHEPGESFFCEKKEYFVKADIYGRTDTMELSKIELLKSLYMKESKHSNYQILAPGLLSLVNENDIQTVSRQEKERIDFICSHVDIRNAKALDIGGNTGYFTFSAIDLGAANVDYYEGNTNHADFVRVAAELLHCNDKINIYPEYYMFDGNGKKYDIIFNLNVLHHLGDDFGDDSGIDKAKEKMVTYINNMAQYTKIMIFQLGFNWKGNREKCLFENGTKAELIQFVEKNCSNKWRILNIGIAEKEQSGQIVYKELNETNIVRDDSLGEFLNRPIFIMESL